jgi:hypothetical protein
VVAGEGAIDPFAKRSGGLAWANGKSHADGVVLPPQCGGGGEWDNGSINVRANMASIWAIFWDISDQKFWGREFSVMASENGAVERYNDIAGANSIGGTAVGQYPPPWSRRWEENMSCSPVDVVMGRLFPLSPRASMALMVMPSARMPAQDGTATPSKGGMEGIVGTGVSRRPEAQCGWASFLYYSFVDKVII